MPSSVHIGRLIREELTRQRRTVSWLADGIGYDRANCYRIFASPSIDTALLLRISRLLGHDFFVDLSDALGSDVSN